jgi:carbonic anhydrase/acetyltransferase-like protein (isoleucine patch superfamily)
MMLKVKRTDIQDGSAVNFGATVMGGAVIEPETTILPLSMVLKEMHLPTGTYWGSPTEPVGRVQHSSPSITQPQAGSKHSKMSGEAANDAESRPTRLTVPDE